LWKIDIMNRKAYNAVTLGLVWMASLGVVFVLGILSAFAFHLGPGAGSGSGDLTLDQRAMMLEIERQTGESADIASIMAVGSGEDVPVQLEQALRGVLRVSNPAERQRAAVLLVRGLPTRVLMGGIRLLQGIPASPGRDQVLGVFLETWASEDGRRSMVFATSLQAAAERELAIQSVLRGWSRVEPSLAWAWVLEQSGSSGRAERWLSIIVSSMGAVDRTTAFQLLEKMPPSNFRDNMSGVIMEQILSIQTPREAMDWLGEFPGGGVVLAATQLAETWAVTEPEAAAKWLYRSYPENVDGFAGVLSEWAYVDPVAATDWVWAAFAGEDRRDLMDLVAQEWIDNEGPAPLASWINSIGPHSALDGAIGMIALQTVDLDPAMAMVWAQSLMDEDNRSTLEIVLGRRWIKMAPQDAENRLPQYVRSESARAALLEPEEEVYYAIEEEALAEDEGDPDSDTDPVQ
jgi:hypothetical protein